MYMRSIWNESTVTVGLRSREGDNKHYFAAENCIAYFCCKTSEKWHIMPAVCFGKIDENYARNDKLCLKLC